MPKKALSVELLEELLKSVEKIGLKRTLGVLKFSQIEILKHENSLSDFIIATICNEYTITKPQLVNGTSHFDSKRVEALTICSSLLYRHCNLTQSDIGFILKKDNSVISKYLKKLKTLNVNFINDKTLQQKLNKIDNHIQEFKNKIN